MKHIVIADAPLRPVKLPHVEDTDSAGAPKRYPRCLRLVIRLMPAVYRNLDLRIAHGDPDASIHLNAAWVRFPDPYDEFGGISIHCRNWIIETVRDAAMKLGLGFFIGFDDPVYVGRDGKAYYSSAFM